MTERDHLAASLAKAARLRGKAVDHGHWNVVDALDRIRDRLQAQLATLDAGAEASPR